ncbi:MAG: copper chaperone PCu(A)C [Anaerolineae bacterium]|nr:copper chaperone PCu(A)C [Anaerolineae bacterium]
MRRSLFLFVPVILLLSLLVLVGCRPEETPPEEANVTLDINVEPDEPVVGEASTIAVTLMRGDEAINDASVEIRGDMNHAGMQPVIRTVEEGTDGVYTTDFDWTMAGDWIVTVNATLADDTVVTQEFSYTIPGEAVDMSDDSDMDMDSEGDAESMDMSSEDGMSGMNMGGGSTTGGYMLITNGGDSDDVLVGVEADFANDIQIHETTVENDMARMVEVGQIDIPAGETATLQPGGYHVMFIDVTRNLMVGDEVEITLNFESGASAAVTAVVGDEAPETSAEYTAGDLTITGVWVRPAAAASDDMDMSGDSDMDMDSDADSEDMDMSEESSDMEMEPTATAES